MKQTLRIVLRLLIVVILTILAKIRGVVYLLSLYINRGVKLEFYLKKTSIFIFLFLITTYLVTPFIAPFFGRYVIVNDFYIKPATDMTILLNRNYVTADLNSCLQDISSNLEKSDSDIQLRYLDIRYQECYSVRHDDHIHIQIK